MGRKDYIRHYFDFDHVAAFLLVNLLGLIAVVAILLIMARLLHRGRTSSPEYGSARSRFSRKADAFRLVESFYEMVFGSTSILFFLALYYLIDARIQSFAYLWSHYKDFALLLFILASVVLNGALDHLFVNIRTLHSEQKAAIRLVSTIYVVLILMYIRFIYEDKNYDELIKYFVALTVGRFLYFDFTWNDFSAQIAGVARNLPLLLLMAAYSGLVCWYGFHSGFLLKSNGVIVSTLIAHGFMDVCIFLLARTGVMERLA